MKKIVIICILILLIAVIVLNNCNNENFANAETKQENTKSELKEVIWENKLLKLDDVIQKLKQSLNECGVNDITLEKTDFTVINSRKRLIELLPVTKLLDKINYNQIQCFVSKFDPENYLVISKTITNVPKILRPKNIVIVNDILYNSTPYGVVKYKIPLLSEFNGFDSLNASIESGVLNDFNTYNMSSDPIFHLEGKLIQRRGNQFVNIKNNDNYEITDINNKIELLNKKIINKLEIEKTQSIQDQNKIVQENKINVETKVIEKMVDVGGLIELKIEDHTQLKVIDTKTFIPVVSTIVKTNQENNQATRQPVIINGQIVSAETVIQEIKQEMINKGIPVSEEAIKQEIIKKITNSETVIQEIKQEMINKGIPVSEEAINKELVNKIANSETAIQEIKLNTSIIQKKDVNIEKLINNLISIFEYDGIIYMAEQSTVRPFSSWALKVNSLLAKNKLTIKGVIPHFYHKNNEFNYRLIFVLSDDFYIGVNKENVSGILDIKKDMNITFNPNIPDTLPCDEIKTILEQMEKANILSREKSEMIIKNYRC
jgi:hypothetical protein